MYKYSKTPVVYYLQFFAVAPDLSNLSVQTSL